jgi:hypothetical protein
MFGYMPRIDALDHLDRRVMQRRHNSDRHIGKQLPHNRGVTQRRVLSRFTGIESPCFNAFRLERALPAEVFGPRPSEPLRRFAAICLSVAILRFPQWF